MEHDRERPTRKSAPAERRAGAAQTPNYAARRMMASTIAITVIVCGGVLAWQLTHRDDIPAIAADQGWSTVAFVSRGTGDVVLVDPTGVTTARFDGDGRVLSAHTTQDRLALVGAASVAVLAESLEAPRAIPIERNRTVTRLSTNAGSLWLAVGNKNGGDVTLIEAGPDADTAYDVAALSDLSAARLFVETIRNDADGTVFALADATNFQTIVVRQGLTEPLFFPDQPVAVADGLVVTSQVVGRRADITLHDFEGNQLATVPSALPAGATIDVKRKQVTLVAVDGTITRFGEGDEQAEPIGALVVPAGGSVQSVHPVADGSRLVVVGDTFEALITLDGATLFTTPIGAPVDTSALSPDLACVALGGPDDASAIVSTDDGAVLADLSGVDVTGSADDGCTVIGTVTKTVVVPAITSPAAIVVPTSIPTSATASPASTAVTSTPVDGSATTPVAAVATTTTVPKPAFTTSTVTNAVVVGEFGRIDLGTPRSAALAPDARAVLQQGTDGRWTLTALTDGALGRSVDLTESAPASPIALFLVR